MTDLADPDDHVLMVDLARGNLPALAGLYRRHGPLVYHLLVAQTGDPDTAQDLLQDTFLALVDQGPRLREVREPRAYLLGIAHRLARHRQRRQRREVTTSDPPVEERGEAAPGSADLSHMLSGLPPEQRVVLALKVWHELTFAEIGRALGLSAHTAASRYRYALQKLRREWGEEDHD